MNVLLVNPPFILSKEHPSSKTGAILPPLGLLYVAAFLRKQHPEVDVQVLDCPTYGLDIEEFGGKIAAFRPDVVGISIYTPTFPAVLEAAKKVKEIFPACIVVGGGPHASILPEECLGSPDIDIAIVGEGEESFNSLVECLMAGAALTAIPNVVYKEDGHILRTVTQPTVLDIEGLPFPARDLVEMPLYRPAHGVFKRLPATNMITSRGCPFHCSFCSKNIFGSRYRAQSASKTLQEIETLIMDYGIKEILFNDDVFTCNRKRTEALCDLLIDRGLNLTWSCSTRVNLVNPDLLGKMKRSGCVSIGYGIEAGDPDIMKKISKGVSLDQAKQAIRWTKEAGIETRAFYILGFPGETRASLQRTVEAALELDTDFVIFNMAVPLPGTQLYEEAKAEGLLIHDGLELYRRTDGPHPLIRLKDVSEEELIRAYRGAYKKYYLRPGYILRQLGNLRSLSDIRRYATGFLSFMRWTG